MGRGKKEKEEEEEEEERRKGEEEKEKEDKEEWGHSELVLGILHLSVLGLGWDGMCHLS